MPEGSPIPGRFSFRVTPYLVEPLDATIDPAVRRVVFRKSAQIGWTDGVVLNLIGHRIDNDPSRMLVLFPREKTAVDFNDEKLEPMIEATPALRAKVNLGSRKAGNRQLFKKFAGGFLKLIASNSPGDVKSTSAPIVIVEEPDDCNQNVRGQGDSITLAVERVKAYHNAKIVEGGTPTIEDVSQIDDEFGKSDKRYWKVPCHACGAEEPLEWDNVQWDKDESHLDPVFGKHRPETARYVCPHCQAAWTDEQKNRNVRRGRWVATALSRGVAGFHANELVSPFPESRLENLVRKWLSAIAKKNAGDPSEYIAFLNATLARSYRDDTPVPKEDVLRERAEKYDEFTVPAGASLLALGIDVQHDRLAIMVWAFGRGEEMWLVYWGEIHGNAVDANDAIWTDIDSYLLRGYRHASGAELHVEACSIDTGDGQTSDAAYAWVRKHRRNGRRVMATKGASETGSNAREIFSVPSKSLDHSTPTKAARYGLKVHQVGTVKAKDLLLGSDQGAGRLNLTGAGPGRLHWYVTVRPDFYEQITAEIKTYEKGSRRKTWQRKSGRRNEGLDATILALHAARSLNAHRMDEAQWVAREQRLRQADLLTEALNHQTAVAEPLASSESTLLMQQLKQQTPAPGGVQRDESRPF